MFFDLKCSKFSKLLIVMFSIGLGVTSVISIYLHLGFIQNFEFSEKIIFLCIGALPLSIILYFLINFALSCFSVKVLLISGIISLLTSSIIILFSYKAPLMVKTHTLSIGIPLEVNGNSNNAFEINKIEIHSGLKKKLTINPFSTSQKNISIENSIYSPGTTLNAYLMYSGNLVIFPKTNHCPSFVIITDGNNSLSQDLCEVNSSKGLIISTPLSGDITWKWKAIEKAIRIVDLLLFSFFLMFLILTLLLFLSNENRKNIQKYILKISTTYINFGIGSILIWLFILSLVYSGFIWFPVFIYFWIFELIVFSDSYIKKFKNFISIRYVYVLLFFLGGIILNIFGKEELRKDLREMPYSLSYSQYSLNSLVNQLHSFPTYIIKFNYDNVLTGRDIIVPTPYIYEFGFHESTFTSQVNFGKIIYTKTPLHISKDEFRCLSSLSHRELKDVIGNRFILLDEVYYGKEDLVLLVRYENNWLLIPVSSERIMEICK